MVAKHVFHQHVLWDRVLPHRDPRRSSHVVFRDLTAFSLVVSAHKADRLDVNHGLYALAIAIIKKLRDNDVVLLHFHEAVFGIVSQIERIRTNNPRDLIPIVVIPIFLRRADVRDSMFVSRVVVIQVQSVFRVEITLRVIRVLSGESPFNCQLVKRSSASYS